MSVKCKAFLTVDGAAQPSEIRSFRLDEGAASNYDYLRGKLSMIFPNLGSGEDQAYTLLWKDSADDMITFSSDAELVEALGDVAKNDGVFRIYVNLKRANLPDFPWKECVNEFWKTIHGGQQGRRNPCGEQTSPSHPNPRPHCAANSSKGCGRNWAGFCGADRSTENIGLLFDTFPMFFPGFHVEVWAHPNSGIFSKSESESQGKSENKEETKEKESPEKPSTSSA